MSLLKMRVDATSYESATRRILDAASAGTSSYVCVANVHMTMEAHDSADFLNVVNGACIVTPDGMPLVWALKLNGFRDASQVRGANLVTHVVERAAERKIPIALYGGTPGSLRDFVTMLEGRYAGIEVVCAISPPFRPLTPEEDASYTEQIKSSGARILFVGIGCPKQEKWMAAHEGKIPAVMLGVGAAFDFHTGRVREAPGWMQRIGLEWAFRLYSDPKRLWKRYAMHNPRFVFLFLLQMIKTYRESRTR